MPVPKNYNNDDDDKKKSSGGGSSSGSSSSSSKSYSTEGYSPKISDSAVSASQWAASKRKEASAAAQASLYNSRAGVIALKTAHTVSPGPTGTRRGSGTRGSSSYNQQQRQQPQYNQLQPQNNQQKLAQSTATTYGLQGIAGIGQQKPDVTADGKWYAGENPNDIESMARIVALDGGDDLKNQLLDERYNRNSQYYRPYAGITSEAVGHLYQLGVNIPEGGLTREWFDQVMPMVRGYYNPSTNSTTGAPTLRKRASQNEKIAYWVYQAAQHLDDTDKAENEYNALKEEIAYYAGSDKNYSDDEIAGKIDWRKYPTLQKMDSMKGGDDGTTMQFVRHIDWDQDYLGGMIWAARNGGGTGDSYSDSVNALLGYGNGYAWNDEIAEKRTWGDPKKTKYSPYSLGMASEKMDEAGMYFGRYDFDDKWIEENSAYYMNSANPKDREMIQRVREANQFTKDCESELDTLLHGELNEEDGTRSGGINDAVAAYIYDDTKSFDENVDALLSEVYDSGDYKNLKKLDDSMLNGTLRDTTRAINYRQEDIRAMLAENLQGKLEAPTPNDTANTNKGFFERVWDGFTGMFRREPVPDPGEITKWDESGAAINDTKQKTAGAAGQTVLGTGTPSEKDMWRTGALGQQGAADSMGSNIKQGVPTGTGGQVMLDLVDGNVDGEDYINKRGIILQYDGINDRINSNNDELDDIRQRRWNRGGGGGGGEVAAPEEESSYSARTSRMIQGMMDNSVRVAAGSVSDSAPMFGQRSDVSFGNNGTEPMSASSMSLDDKTGWLDRVIATNGDLTSEDRAKLSAIRDEFIDAYDFDLSTEGGKDQMAVLDDKLQPYIDKYTTRVVADNTPEAAAIAEQRESSAAPNAVDPGAQEVQGFRQAAVDTVARLNPELAGASFEQASEWLSAQAENPEVNKESPEYLDAVDAVREAELVGENRVLEYRKSELQGSYDEAYETLRALYNRYDEQDTVWHITGSGGVTEVRAADVLDRVAQYGDYRPYPYSDQNYYDYLKNEKGYSDEEVYQFARDDTRQYIAMRDQIKADLDACDQKGVRIPAEYRQHMNDMLTMLDNRIADGQYYGMRFNDDFEEKYKLALAPKEYTPGLVQPVRPAGLTDLEYACVSALDGTNVSLTNIRAMTEDEQKTFLYVKAMQGGQAAQKYYDHLTDEYGVVTTRQGREMTEQMYNDFRAMDAMTANIGGTAATIAMHPMQVMGGAYMFGMMLQGKAANPDSAFFSLGKASQKERETIKGMLGESVTAMWGDTAGEIAKRGYDTVVSVGDNLMDAATMRGIGFNGVMPELGNGASFAKKVAWNAIDGTITALPLGISAGGMTYIEAIGRGLSPEQAYMLAGCSTLAESVTEGLEIESFTEAYDFAKASGFKGFCQNVLLSMANEAVGEGAGQFFESNMDTLIAGALSNREQYREQLLRSGVPQDQIETELNRAMANEVFESALMGAASGGLSTAITGTTGAIVHHHEYSQFQKANADFFTNLENSFREGGDSKSVARQKTKEIAQRMFDAQREEAYEANEPEAPRRNPRSEEVDNFEIAEREQTAEQAAEQPTEQPAEPRRNPRSDEVDNFEITPIQQYDDLKAALAKVDGEENYDGSVESSAANTLDAAIGYTEAAREAEAEGDTESAEDLSQRGMRAFEALDQIMERAGIDKSKFPILTSIDAMNGLRQQMAERFTVRPMQGPVQTQHGGGMEAQTGMPEINPVEAMELQGQAPQLPGEMQGPLEQVEQTGGEQTTLLPGESEIAPVVDNEGLTAEDARQERASIRQEMGQTETAPEINPVEAMETVNRGPEALRPIQGPRQPVNPFSGDFRNQLRQNDRMKGQVLTLSEAPSTPQSGTTMLSSVFGSVMDVKDAISNGQTMAAARALVSKFEAQKAVDVVRSIIVSAAEQGINNTDAVTAVQTAALTDGDAARMLEQIVQIGAATPNRVKSLVSSALTEAGTRAQEMWTNTFNGIVTEVMYEMAGDGALNGVLPYQQAERQAHTKVKESEQNVEKQWGIIEANRNHLDEVQGPYLEDPTNQTKKADWNAAREKLGNSYTVLSQYQQQLQNRQTDYTQALDSLHAIQNQEMTKLREAARREAEARIAVAREQRQEREAQRQSRANAVVGKSGTAYLNSTQPIDYHYELVDDNALIASNDVNGTVNPEYPSYLQPRDRTRAVSQAEVQDRAAHLNPEMLGANPDIAQGAPVIGPDYAVESGNGRMMAIRLARQGNLPGAVRYTEMLRDRAAEFGFRPEQIGPSSVLVRVRDTPVNRADFTRAANVQATSRMSTPEQAKIDADRLTPEMLAKYNMETDTGADAFKGKQNQDFLDAFLKTIPDAEMGNTRDAKGMISEDGKDRVRNALIQFAYNSDRLTSALTESTDDVVKNLKRVLSNLAPVVSNYRSDISEGRFDNIGLLDTLTEAVENYVDLKTRGENIYDYVNNYVMEGFEEISNAAKEMMLMFEQNVRSGKKIGRYLTDLIRNVTKEQDTTQTALFNFGDIATDLASTIRGSFDQTAQAIQDETNGIAKGQVGFLKDIRALRETTRQSDVSFPSLGISRTVAFTGTDAEIADAEAKEAERASEFERLINSNDFMALEMRKPDGRSEILHRSSRPGVVYQLTYMGSDGEPTMHESYGANGENTTGQNIHSMDELYRHFIIDNLDSDITFNVMRSDNIRALRAGAQGGQAGQSQGAPARSPAQISKDLMAKLGIGDYVPTNKDIPKGVLGYYRERANYIAVTPNEAGNFTTTMHEIGHAISEKIGLTGTQQMVNNLPAAFQNAYSQAELPGEAFAEFMWRYMENDQSARQFAGDAFVDDFERRLDDAGIADDVHDSANAMRQFLNADASEKIGAVIRDASDRRRKPIREILRSFIAGNIDASSAAENLNSKIRKETGKRQVDFSVDVRQNARMQNSAEKRAAFILTKGMTDANWTRTGEDGLAQVFEKNNINTKNDVDLLGKYLLAKHSFDRDAQGKPVFSPTITEAERRTFINDVETNHPNIVAAAEGFQTFRHNVMKYLMVDTGFLGPNGDALLRQWEQMYPNYVPTYRARDVESNTMGASGYQVMEAKGSTEDILNPIESFASIVKKIVTQVSRNNTALAMHNAFQTVGNLGEFMREISPDSKKVSVDTRSLQKTVENILTGEASATAIQDVLNAIGERQEEWVEENGTKVPNAITVQLPDGTRTYYEVKDQELYNLLAAVPPAQIGMFAQTVGRATRGMTALTTGSNPLFAFRNAMRDYQNSVNYGSWAATYLTGAPKWLKAFYEVWTGSNDFKDYEALGGGGWMRINPAQKKSARELRNELIPGYENGTVKGTASKAINKVSSLVTLERLNEVIEQTSRFVEYKYGKHDLDTAEGRQEAYLAGQDVTVDFGRRGYGPTMNVIKQVIPFFSAATQGVYRTGRMLTEAERGRALPRFAKTVVNTALMSALAAGIMLKFGKDDDKFAFENMSDDLKSNHVFFPNIAPEVFGPRPLIRIPLAQDPLTYAVHGFMTNAIWYGTRDQDVIDIAAVANTILDNLNPASGGPIWSAASDVQKNRTWYGSKIIPTRLEELDTNPTAQYTADTPDLFVGAARGIETITKGFPGAPTVSISPLNLQYLAEQYTGFVGQLLIPALSKDKHTGELGGWNAAIASAQNRFTTDPLVSNETVGTFYDNFNFVSDVVTTVKDGQPLNMLRTGISQGEANRAYKDAEKLTGKDGILAKTKQKVTDLYNHIDKTNANPSLSDEDKYRITSEDRMQMVKACLRANEEVERYRENYVTGIDISTYPLWVAWLTQNPKAKKKKK